MQSKNRSNPASRKHRTPRMTRTRMPLTETLEGRILFANRIWDGGAGAGDPNWTTAANWQGNDAPEAGINIDGSGSYAISGNAIELGSGGINVSGNASHTFNMPITLGNAGRSVSVTDLASLSMSGPFIGNGAINKNANGLLELTSDSPDFDGAVNVNAGAAMY